MNRPEDLSSYPEASSKDALSETAKDEAFEVVRDINNRLSDEVPTLPIQQKTQVERVVREVIEQRISHFSGPLPPPELLSQYDQTCPGAAKQVMQMGLDEQRHRHACDRRELDQKDERIRLEHREATYSISGLILGFLAFLVIAGIGVYALRLGEPWLAGGCFTAFGIGVISQLVRGRGRTRPNQPETGEEPGTTGISTEDLGK